MSITNAASASKSNLATPVQDMGRLPPHSIEAEQSVLGGLLLDNQCWDEVCELITGSEAFYLSEHRILFKAIQALSLKSLPFDVITIAEQLTETERQFLDLAYLASLARNTPSVANIRVYAQIVRDRWQLRQLSQVGATLAREALDGQIEGEALVERTEKHLAELVESPTQAYTSLTDTLNTVIDHIDLAFNQGTGITGLSTGFSDLDRNTAGLQPADLIIVAGRPAMGKTTFGVNLVENALTNVPDRPAFVFSLEMPREQLVMRMVASQGRLDLQKIRTGTFNDEDWVKLAAASSKLTAWNDRLIIDDESGLSATAIKARARRMARRFGQPSLILIDYLQLIQEPGRTRDNRNLEIAAISLALKQLARELKTPVVALSQLNRSVEQRPNKRPNNADLRDSGAIEQDADMILFVYRDEVYHPETEHQGIAEILIGKQRNGPIGTVRLAFNGQCTRFDSLSLAHRAEIHS